MVIVRIVGIQFRSVNSVVRLVLVDGCLSAAWKFWRRNVSFGIDCIGGCIGIISFVFVGE